MRYPRLKPELDRRRKLMPEDVSRLRSMRALGWKFQALADNFGISISTVYEHVYPERYTERRKKKSALASKRYRTDPKFRKLRVHQALEHRVYKKANSPEIEEKMIAEATERIRQRFKKWRKDAPVKT